MLRLNLLDLLRNCNIISCTTNNPQRIHDNSRMKMPPGDDLRYRIEVSLSCPHHAGHLIYLTDCSVYFDHENVLDLDSRHHIRDALICPSSCSCCSHVFQAASKFQRPQLVCNSPVHLRHGLRDKFSVCDLASMSLSRVSADAIVASCNAKHVAFCIPTISLTT